MKKILLRLFVIFIAFIIVVLLFDKAIMPLYTKHGMEYELPDVTEKMVVEGVQLLEDQGYSPVIKDSVYDENYPPGAIVRQTPLPYTLVKKGRRIYLVISIGEKPISMPNLIGLTPKDAEFRLKEELLRLNRVIYEFSEFYPNGVVINQSVPSGVTMERNQRVNITVSLGQPPSKIEVPNIVGKSLTYVKKELQSIGVKLGEIKYQYRPNLVPETVVAQSIPAGKPLENVQSIDITVSTDIPPKVPEKEGI